jgi:hypothetical protein
MLAPRGTGQATIDVYFEGKSRHRSRVAKCLLMTQSGFRDHERMICELLHAQFLKDGATLIW